MATSPCSWAIWTTRSQRERPMELRFKYGQTRGLRVRLDLWNHEFQPSEVSRLLDPNVPISEKLLALAAIAKGEESDQKYRDKFLAEAPVGWTKNDSA